MIEDVEELRSEAESNFFGEAELALEGKVHLRGAETAQHVASEIALRSGAGGAPCPDLV